MTTILRTTVLTCLLAPTIHGQTAQQEPELNRAVLRYFDTDRLKVLVNDPERLDRVMYYFTGSFTVEPADCPGCTVDYNEFYNTDLFNVAEHEYLRLPSAPAEIVYRDKYRVVLKPVTEISQTLGSVSSYELINGIPFRPLPSWPATGDDAADLAAYKAEIQQWKTDFPKEFAETKRSPSLVRIRYSMFTGMTPDQRQQLLAESALYLIMDDEIAGY